MFWYVFGLVGVSSLPACNLRSQDILVVAHVVDIDDRLIATCAPIFQFLVVFLLREQRQHAAQLEPAVGIEIKIYRELTRIL